MENYEPPIAIASRLYPSSLRIDIKNEKHIYIFFRHHYLFLYTERTKKRILPKTISTFYFRWTTILGDAAYEVLPFQCGAKIYWRLISLLLLVS
jgi:hypothetical protein